MSLGAAGRSDSQHLQQIAVRILEVETPPAAVIVDLDVARLEWATAGVV